MSEQENAPQEEPQSQSASAENDQLPQVIEAGSLALLARAEVDVQISTAHAFPRSISAFKAEARSMVTLNEDLAASCFYKLPRGKDERGNAKLIEGPSVRLAEIVGSAWGNIRYGSRVIQIGEKSVTAQGVCHDLQKNVSATLEVQRRITNRHGKRFNDDMIGVTAAAACSIALRNAIFRVVPMAFVQELMQLAKQTAIGDAKTLASRRDRMIVHFSKMGVGIDRILRRVEVRGVDDIGLQQLEDLLGLATSIKDGDVSIDNAFPEEKPAEQVSRTATVGDQVKAAAEASKTTTAPEPGPAPTTPAPAGPATPAQPANVPPATPVAPAQPQPPASAPQVDPAAHEKEAWAKNLLDNMRAASTEADLYEMFDELQQQRAWIGETQYQKLGAEYQVNKHRVLHPEAQPPSQAPRRPGKRG